MKTTMKKLNIAQFAICLVPSLAVADVSVLSGSTSRVYVAQAELKNHRYNIALVVLDGCKCIQADHGYAGINRYNLFRPGRITVCFCCC